MGCELTVEPSCLESVFQNIVCGASRHPFFALSVARWKHGTLNVEFSVVLAVPTDKIFNGTRAVCVHRHGSRYFTAFDDGFVEQEIGDGSAVLVDIGDR